MERRNTRAIRLGPMSLGGGAPVLVQTMASTPTGDAAATLAQIGRAFSRGAEAVRVAVPDKGAAGALARIAAESPVPIVADIHFDHRLALLALKAGVAGLRINPGNIGGADKIRAVAEAAGKAGAAIRVGVNSGSLDKEMLSRYGHGAEAMVMSALKEAALVESTGFRDIKVSLKASSVLLTVEAARLFSRRSDLPQHLGVTEAGDLLSGAIKSSVGLGLLLAGGIGDTVRVSLTAPPEDEVDCAYQILRALGLRKRGPEFISCPTCGRCRIDLPSLLSQVKAKLSSLTAPLTIAVMGCSVNGPGEARAADAGVAGGASPGRGRLFAKGEKPLDLPIENLAQALADKAWALSAGLEGEREKSGEDLPEGHR
jgi:(E)-4-hydroxy-3-methylbut-2-enyl-diphosphate synthase